MDIFLMGDGKPVLLTEEHTRQLDLAIIDQRKNLPILLRRLIQIPGQGKYLDIVGGFTRFGVHGEYCQIDFDRAIGWGIVIDGVPRFRGVLFSDWTTVPSSAQKFIDTVKSRLGL